MTRKYFLSTRRKEKIEGKVVPKEKVDGRNGIEESFGNCNDLFLKIVSPF